MLNPLKFGLLNSVVVLGVVGVNSPQFKAFQHYQNTHVAIEVGNASMIPKFNKPLTKFDKQEINCLAVTAYYEAANQGEVGMLAVISVVYNRLLDKKKRWGNSLCEVVTATHKTKYKGSNGKLYKVKVHHDFSYLDKPLYPIQKKPWQTAYSVAYRAYLYGGGLPDVSKNALYYLAPKATNVRRKNEDITAVIKDHVFYSN